MERFAYNSEWSAFILDQAVAQPGNLTDKDEFDIRNGYILLMNKTAGTQVSFMLQPPALALGQAKDGFRIVHEFYHRNTPSGHRDLNNKLNTSSMSKDNSNIVEFVAALRLR